MEKKKSPEDRTPTKKRKVVKKKSVLAHLRSNPAPPNFFKNFMKENGNCSDVIISYLCLDDIKSLEYAVGISLRGIPLYYSDTFCFVCHDTLKVLYSDIRSVIRKCDWCLAQIHNECSRNVSLYIRSDECTDKHRHHDYKKPQVKLASSLIKTMQEGGNLEDEHCYRSQVFHYCPIHETLPEKLVKLYPSMIYQLNGRYVCSKRNAGKIMSLMERSEPEYSNEDKERIRRLAYRRAVKRKPALKKNQRVTNFL